MEIITLIALIAVLVITGEVTAWIVGRPLPPGYKPGQRDTPNRKKPKITKRPPDPPAR